MSKPVTRYRPIDGFPGYLVGSDGSVWSCRRAAQKCQGEQWPRWKKLLPKIEGEHADYERVILYGLDGNRQKFSVHTLVLTAFVGSRPNGKEGCHKDGNSLNNEVTNLYWGTHQDNTDDMKRHGRFRFGNNHHQSKLSESVIPRIFADRQGGMFLDAIAKKYGVTRTAIRKVLIKKTWVGPPKPPEKVIDTAMDPFATEAA